MSENLLELHETTGTAWKTCLILQQTKHLLGFRQEGSVSKITPICFKPASLSSHYIYRVALTLTLTKPAH